MSTTHIPHRAAWMILVLTIAVTAAASRSPAQTLYLVDASSDTLYSVNNLSGAATAIGPTGLANAVGLAFDGVDLYALNFAGGGAGGLFRVDPATGVTTLVANTGGISWTDIAWDPFTQRFFASTAADILYSIGLDGTATLIGSTPSSMFIAAIAIDDSGRLWAFDFQGTGALGRLDKSTAAFTSVAATTLAGFGGMSFYPTGGAIYATNASTDSLYGIPPNNPYVVLVGPHGGSPPVTLPTGLCWTTAVIPSPDFEKVMITEVSWGSPDGCEITNFSSATVDLNGWNVLWHEGTILRTSSDLDVSIAPGESILVLETTTVSVPESPLGTQILEYLPTILTASEAHNVALRDSSGGIVDEVRVSSTSGTNTVPSLGGVFRGLAVRGALSGTSGAVGVERLWGLDSDGGADWTEQPNRSFGIENRSSGPRGTDPIPLASVKINETDDSPDYVELRNTGTEAVNLTGWFFLMSSVQNSAPTRIDPFARTTGLAPGGFIVIGDFSTPPAELPAGVIYIDVTGNIPWTTGEYDCALYDALGRLVDSMRTTGPGDQRVHNHPRSPSYWSDFCGAAGRTNNSGDQAIGRSSSSTDTDTGADWYPIFTRTMGSANSSSSQAGGPGHGHRFDVRLNDTGRHGGIALILNAGAAHAGERWSFAFSAGHQNGQGIFFGLGLDAVANFLTLYNVPPWYGFLDAQGSARLDGPPLSLPAGLQTDDLFILQSPAGAVTLMTKVVEWDTF